MTTIADLKRIRKQWLEDTFSGAQVKKEFKITSAEIKFMESVTEYGKTGYHKNEVARFLRVRDKNRVI